MSSLSSTEVTLLQRIEQLRIGSFKEGAHAMRSLVYTLRIASSEALAAITKATARTIKRSIVLPELRKTAAMKDLLGDTAAASVLGVGDAAGSVLTGSQTNNTSVTETASCVHVLHPDYVAGAAITVRIRAKVSANRQVAQQVDLVAKKISDGVLGADICATAAQAITTNYVDYDFTITPTGLVAGDSLQLDFYLINNDTGGASNGTATISEISVRETITT